MNYLGNLMRPGILGVGGRGCPGDILGVLGNQTDPFNLVLLALTNKKLRYICFLRFAVFWCLPKLKR